MANAPVNGSANLSKDYFTNRQDRYMAITHPRYADYVQSVILVGQAMSFVLKTGEDRPYYLKWPKEKVHGLPNPSGGSALLYKARAREMWRVMQAHWTGPEHRDESAGAQPGHLAEDEVEIRPFLQMGVLGIREETDLVVPYLLRLGEGDGVQRLDLTSGYFSLDADNQRRVLASPASEINVVCASPLVSMQCLHLNVNNIRVLTTIALTKG